MNGRIEGKVALITGGASGLGAAIAARFVAEGARVVIADIDDSANAACAERLGPTARAIALDVTDEEAWIAAFADIAGNEGRLDVLVNNAGITTIGSVEDLSLADFRQMLDIDLVGPFLGCKHCVTLMRQSGGGSVINMSSMAGLRASANLAGYNAAKAGVTLLTKSAALHYAAKDYPIRCNSVHPGATRTPIIDMVLAQSGDPDALLASFVEVIPQGRLGMPEEIASICLYLASDESAFATAAEFTVDGGASAALRGEV